MGTVLVTGGKGFLGQHIVKKFTEYGEDVRIFARPNGHSNSNEKNVVWGDIRDYDAVERAVDGVDSVVHLVSNFRHGGSDKHEAYDINVVGTENVLNASLKKGVKRIVHCSTIGVHGDVKEIPATEKTPFNPGDLYQETKLTAEQKVWDFYQKTGLPIAVVRPISLFGPGDERMLKLFRMIKKGRFIMFGAGDAYFQPAYIDDVVRGFHMCLTDEAAIGEAFIIGSEEYLPLRNLVQVIAEELKVPPPKIKLPLTPALWMASVCEQVCVPFGVEPPIHRRRMSFYQNNRAFSIDKAKTVLGYKPEISLREATRRTIRWYEAEGWL
ncbi:MAG TPA: NAD-dependent epimerase/dehydratase family protein [Anaerolineae bacterium]|nr:NAD-dependent epimerase/dehydratase family protein [Anaerolineae bacterium]